MNEARNDDSYRPWMKIVLLAAAAYNVLWGTWVIARPLDMFIWSGIEPPTYVGIWQCVGMIVGVYGIGYAIAATAPLRHWPIVLVGFLGKLLGPIGMIHNVLTIPPGTPGRLPASWLWLNFTNDFIWLVPFAVILYSAFRHWNAPVASGKLSLRAANVRFQTQKGSSLSQLSEKQNVLLVFLRHRGCTFCRETLAELSRQKSQIEQDCTIVLIHMGEEDDATKQYFRGYGLDEVHRISDPQCELYRAYDLQRGQASELLGPAVWWRGFQAAILARHGVGKLVGDGFQMPGAFLIRDNQIVKAFRPETPADQTDLCELAS